MAGYETNSALWESIEVVRYLGPQRGCYWCGNKGKAIPATVVVRRKSRKSQRIYEDLGCEHHGGSWLRVAIRGEVS